MKSSQLDLEKPDNTDDIRSVRSMSIASRSEGGKRLPIYNRTQIVGKLVKIFTEDHNEGSLIHDSPETKIRISEANPQREQLLNGTKSPSSKTFRNTHSTSPDDEIAEEA